MNLYLKIFSVLSFLVLAGSCSGPNKCVGFHEDFAAVVQPVIQLPGNSPVLYQASFEVLKYKFSGLIAFRKISKEEEIRVAMLSEVGLKLMEFSYSNQQITTTYCSPVITKKSVPKFIGSFLDMLIHEPQCKSICFYAEGGKSNYFCKAKSEKLFIETGEKGLTSMQLYKSRKKSVKSSYIKSTNVPDEITVQMKYRTTIHLIKIDNAFK